MLSIPRFIIYVYDFSSISSIGQKKFKHSLQKQIHRLIVRISQNLFFKTYYVVFVCFNLGMEATVEKIEKLFDRFNVWDLLGENYWAMLLADRPEYAKQKHLKIKSVAYNPLIVMESNKHIYLKKLENEKRMGNFPFSDEYKRRLEVDNYPEALYIYKYIDGILLFTSREWMIILSRAPNLFEFAVSKGALNVLDDYSKSFILHKQPSLGDRICVKKKFEFTISHAKEKNSLETEFDKKLIDERQRAIEDINTKILNNEDSLIQITPKMWSLAIENNPAISDYSEKYSTANGDKKTGYLAFTRENWLRVLLQHKEIIKTAVKYKAFKLFNPGDWRTLLCEDFDFFYPIAEEYGALQKFYEADWYMLIRHFI